MIVLFDSVGNALKRCRRMIELACDFNSKLRMPPDRIIVDRDPAIGSNELASSCEHERIDLKRTRFDAACRGKQSLDRIGKLSRMCRRKSTRTDSFLDC